MVLVESTDGAYGSPIPRICLTRREAAEACGVSEDTIRRAKNTGALKAKRLTSDPTRLGGKELYSPAALQAWFDGLPDA